MTFSKMAGSLLAKHHAEIVAGWKRWEWMHDDDNPKQGNLDGGAQFLVRALAGSFPKEGEPTIPPAGQAWFSSVFNAQLKQPRHTALRRFVDECLNHAGYRKEGEIARRKREVYKAYDERRKHAQSQQLPWQPMMTPEESAILKQPEGIEDDRFPKMTEQEFSCAWDCGGEKLAKVKSIIAEREKQHAWESSEFFIAAINHPLPIKGVMARELPSLQARLEEMGRTKTAGGKRRNSAAYLSDVERELRNIARECFGLPRKA